MCSSDLATAAAIARALETRAAKVAAPAPEAAPVQGASLWDMLTPEEQAFFARQDALGSLTYGRRETTGASRTPSAAPLGSRIDVKA